VIAYLLNNTNNKASNLDISDVLVVQGVLGTDACLGVELQHALEQIDAFLGYKREEVFQALFLPSREGALEVGQFLESGPYFGGRGAHDRKDLEDLFDFIAVAEEEGLAGEAFDEDTANGPDIDCAGVKGLSEKDFWGPVPEGFDFVGESLLRDHHESGQPEVGNFDVVCIA
jgi:hypothetical protein